MAQRSRIQTLSRTGPIWAMVLAGGLCLPPWSHAARGQERPALDHQRTASNAALSAPSQASATRNPLERARQHFEQGMDAYRQEQLGVAQQELTLAYRLLPSAALAYNLAHIHERLGEIGDAVHWYETYLELGAESVSDQRRVRLRLRSLRGRAANEEGPGLQLLPASAPELNAEARRFFRRGVRLFRGRQLEAALAAFAAALRLSDAPELYFNLGLTSARLGRAEDAIAFYRQYLHARPQADDRRTIEAAIAALRGRG